MQNFIYFLRKRFPLIPLLILGLFNILSIANYSTHNKSLLFIIIISLIPTAFLFHMRILDEFKDFEFDKEKFPDRPLHSGAISKGHLIFWGIINIILLSFIMVLSRNFLSVILFVFTIGYSGLMFKEFFIHKFWEKSPILYLVSHQIVFVFLFSSIYIIFFDYSSISSNILKFVVHFLFVYMPLLIIELGRKIEFRYDTKGKITNDTYAALWGQRFTINLVVFISFFVFTLNFIVKNFSLVEYLLMIFILFVYTTISLIRFKTFIVLSEKLTFLLVLLALVVYAI